MSEARVIIVGATSAIAAATAQIYAERKSKLVLLGRNTEKLEVLAGDLTVRGAVKVVTHPFSASELNGAAAVIDRAVADLGGGFDVAVVAHGSLPDQARCEESLEETLTELTTNFLSPVAFLHSLALHAKRQGAGTIIGISSVAGDRGRQSNYVYGAAKGGMSNYLAGLRNKLAVLGVSVISVKPGFVDTPMTAHLKKGPLFASPAKVAGDIVRAADSGRDVLYTPWFWRWIMTIICSVPERIFKRLKL